MTQPLDTSSLSREEAQAAADTLFNYLRDILYAPKHARLEPEQLAEPFRDLARGVLFIGKCIEENRSLAKELGKGNLDTTLSVSPDNEIASGLKTLQATLKHISWQVGQIAKGDYNQRLNHAGMFSSAINDMTELLKERNNAMRSEIKLSKQLADDSRNTVLLLESITKSIDELIVVVDRSTHELLYHNHEPLEYMLDEESVEKAKVLLYEKVDEYLREPTPNREWAQPPQQSLIKITDDDGTVTQVFSVVGYPITWMDRKSVVLKLVDITQLQREQEELEQVAYHDTLTKAYSRHYGMHTLERWVLESLEFTLAFVDMDGLKYVNDTFGHLVGDEYILATSKKLSGFGKRTVICRLGGDEFMLLLPNYPIDRARAELEEMRRQLKEEGNGCGYDRSFSFGLVEVDKNNTKSASRLLSYADEHMYEDKRSRKKERLVEVGSG